MRHFSAFCMPALVIVAWSAPMSAGAACVVPLPRSPNLTIRIYDYARTPDKTLSHAMAETRRIYRRTGIEVRLVRCRVAATDPVLHPCHTESTGPAVIQARLLPKEMASLAKLDKSVFGFAMTARRPDYGVIANVFYDSVDEMAADYGYRGYNTGVVLGYVLAHEVGHLLLGDTGHSKRGIMRIPWKEAELFQVHVGQLAFTRQEAARIRRGVKERIDAQRAKDFPREFLVGSPSDDFRRAGG